uniref:Serine protease HTRA2, mitochondrial n=1 Tax=Hippocampus comes TaxID=109280 RepID=A0A3Q2YXE7_HIPCM
MPLQAESGGVRQRREDIRQFVPAEGCRQEGKAAGAPAHQPGSTWSMSHECRYSRYGQNSKRYQSSIQVQLHCRRGGEDRPGCGPHRTVPQVHITGCVCVCVCVRALICAHSHPRHPLFGRNIPLSSGSGFVISQHGLIVTNAHVVSSNSPVSARQHLKVQMHNGDVYDASIRDIDKKLDIATIKINPQSELPVLLLGHSADLRAGEFVVAIGSPFALQNTVTTGIVSTAQRDGKELGLRDSDMDYVQTDAIINFGNSGGPLVNLDGEVIGINTLKVAAGISFAIPSDRITRFLNDSLDKHGKGETSNAPLPPRPSPSDIRPIKKRFIGIRMLTITPALVEELRQQKPDFPDVPGGGIYVHEVVPHSPAQKGGIRDGDIIVKLNGRPVVSTAQLQRALREETALLLEVRRDNDDLLFNIEPDVIVQYTTEQLEGDEGASS